MVAISAVWPRSSCMMDKIYTSYHQVCERDSRAQRQQYWHSSDVEPITTTVLWEEPSLSDNWAGIVSPHEWYANNSDQRLIRWNLSILGTRPSFTSMLQQTKSEMGTLNGPEGVWTSYSVKCPTWLCVTYQQLWSPELSITHTANVYCVHSATVYLTLFGWSTTAPFWSSSWTMSQWLL